MTAPRLLIAALVASIGFIVLSYPETSFSMVAGSLIALSTSSTLIFFSLAVLIFIFRLEHRSGYQSIEQAQPDMAPRPNQQSSVS